MSSSGDALPAHLVHLCTLVLVSRASASTAAAHSSSSGPGANAGAPLGFTHARTHALDTLAHLLQSYLSLAAATAATAANHAGRDKAAVWDLAHALAQLGFPGQDGIDELTDEALRGHDGVEEEAGQIAQLARGLQDRLAPPPPQLPLAQLSYDPLNPSELDLIAYAKSLPSPTDDGRDAAATPSSSSPASSVSDDELASPPPQRADAQPASSAKAGDGDDEMAQEAAATAAAAGGMNGFGGALDDLGGLLTGAGDDDAAFFDSLGLGPGGSALGAGTNGVNGVGDVTASVFHPLDLAGRPIDSISLLGPPSLSSLSLFPTGAEGAAPPADTDESRPFPAWRDPSSIPPHVPPFFPPFPGHERESDSAAARRRRRAELEKREREALAAQTAQQQHQAGASRVAQALMLGGAQGGDPWEDPIPYSASSLATMASEFGHSLPTPSSPRGRAAAAAAAAAEAAARGAAVDGVEGGGAGGDAEEREKKRRRRAAAAAAGGDAGARRRSLSPPPAASTSLGAFAQIQPLIPHQPTYLRPNALRRSAAGNIAYQPRHPELSISSDSLFGSLPYAAPLRQSTLPPGFLPDLAPTAALHPFNTNLPWTISNPVPYHPASTSSVLPAPGPNPRVPTPLSSIARELSFPLQFDPRPSHKDQLHPNIALFARLGRIGPPGPLGPKGEALNYEYVGNTALLALSGVDWPERRHDRKLPKRFGEDDTFSGGDGGGGGAGGASGSGAGGIKLKLGGGGANSAANRGGGGGSGGGDAFGGAGRQTREGSLAQIATPWNTFGSPAPFPGGGAATPFAAATPGGTAFVGGSTGDAELDTQLAQLSAGMPLDLASSSAAAAVAASSSSATAAAAVDASFNYPDWLLEAGGLGSGSATTAAAAPGESASAPSEAHSNGAWASSTTNAADSMQLDSTTHSRAPRPPPPPPPPPPAAALDTHVSASEPPPTSISAQQHDSSLDPALGAPGSSSLDPALEPTPHAQPDGDGDAAMHDGDVGEHGHDASHDASHEPGVDEAPVPEGEGEGEGEGEEEQHDDVERAVEQSLAQGVFAGLPGFGGL
ncbi:uncharacterized protein RHOBADRAFT_56145 [Rhodotorula graminis WP1]|uniref:Bromodomain associated domain-containing protein n=1 Tax=Rhodotorula graminis (strain WP1) TaxID=578459 RepID=A0A0P9GX48_RHOGW|nr:uncharacterized protein RHOBADRAFT_56145 [Rhodotorula graminis WP1]KPV72008.1 hypothetical protein RHOBADRAFT_56145 [Rhodotorula graminis WP1]